MQKEVHRRLIAAPIGRRSCRCLAPNRADLSRRTRWRNDSTESGWVRRFHRWRDSQGLVNAAEIVVHENRPSQRKHLVRRAKRRTRIVRFALKVGGRNVLRIRLAEDGYYPPSDALGGTCNPADAPLPRQARRSKGAEEGFHRVSQVLNGLACAADSNENTPSRFPVDERFAFPAKRFLCVRFDPLSS